jgi:hypothetical protein
MSADVHPSGMLLSKCKHCLDSDLVLIPRLLLEYSLQKK